MAGLFIPAVLPFLTILTLLQGQRRLLGACCQLWCCQPCGVGAADVPPSAPKLHRALMGRCRVIETYVPEGHKPVPGRAGASHGPCVPRPCHGHFPELVFAPAAPGTGEIPGIVGPTELGRDLMLSLPHSWDESSSISSGLSDASDNLSSEEFNASSSLNSLPSTPTASRRNSAIAVSASGKWHPDPSQHQCHHLGGKEGMEGARVRKQGWHRVPAASFS